MTSIRYDFIIVGAGSAGCVLADRLTACGRHKVLLIEAGGSDARFWIRMPLGYAYTFSDRKLNWGYVTQPDPALNSRQTYWPRGRVVGGSSSINAMAYVRGLPHDFDAWDNAGASGWHWRNVQETYERMETHSEIGVQGKRQLRGSGPLMVADLSDQMAPFSERFLQAAYDMGWGVTRDMNGPVGEGLSYYRSTVHKGRRFSAADAFLRPARRRANLTVVSKALVERIKLRNGRATGLQYRVGQKTFHESAGREVIISAGAINSPQLLQLSGIGPAPLLKSNGIDVHHDLNEVGKGLQDHLAISYTFSATEPTLNNDLGTYWGQMTAGMQYLWSRRGPLSVPVNQVGGFVRSDPSRSTPDMQIFCNPVSYTMSETGWPIMDSAPGYLISAQPCRPTSRGEIRIASRDPKDAPLIVPNSLSTDADRDAALRASKLLRKLVKSPTLAKVTKTCTAPDIAKMDDCDLLENYREKASTVFHPTCTCRMGRDASDSVIDAQLKVHGLRGLRVVDASAFPSITSGNTNAPTMMLAMRAADMILEEARH